MSIPEGYLEYQKREFCRDIKCRVQILLDRETENSDKYDDVRKICVESCIHSCHEFHAWLIHRGYLLVRPL